MDKPKMAGTATRYVPRPRDPPHPDEVLDRMVENRCYVVADLVVDFQDKHDPSRGTVRNRLEYLVEDGTVERRKHANGTVTYRRIK
jgi:Fe2+ or Zn2+ uptake regulation protein